MEVEMNFIDPRENRNKLQSTAPTYIVDRNSVYGGSLAVRLRGLLHRLRTSGTLPTHVHTLSLWLVCGNYQKISFSIKLLSDLLDNIKPRK